MKINPCYNAYLQVKLIKICINHEYITLKFWKILLLYYPKLLIKQLFD